MKKIFFVSIFGFIFIGCKQQNSIKNAFEVKNNNFLYENTSKISPKEDFILPEKKQDTTDWQKDKLFGKVKMIHLREDFLGNSGIDNDTLISHYISHYNTAGYKTEYLYNDLCCSGFFKHFLYFYDTKGRLNEAKIYNHENKLSGKIFYTYNNLNLLEKAIEYSIGKNENDLLYPEEISYKYDKKGNEIEFNSKNHFNELRKYIRSYNKQNYMIEEKCYECADDDFECLDKYGYVIDTYLYNKQGYVQEIVSYDSKGNFQHKYTYKYNDKGLCTEQKEYKETENQLKTTIVYEYTFDSYGNWVHKQEYRNGKKSTTSLRKIIYYQ